jgi:transcriptional regulator with XRE-family HTH domain
MKDPVSIRCRLIGASLREHRERAGWTIEEAARFLGCDRSKISRIETGTRGVIPAEVARLLDQYAPDPAGREALLALASASTGRGWWEDFRALLSPGYRDIMATEHAATSITIYAPVAIPELLHTRDYARALAAASQVPAHIQDKAVAATMARQKAILAARSARVSVLLAAAALRQRPADATVMRDQLRFLADLGEAHPRVSIQLLPLTTCLHAAGGSGTFTILSFSHDPAPTQVLADGPGGGAFLDDQHTTATYQRAHDELRTLALTQDESARWLRRMSGEKAQLPGTPPALVSGVSLP